MYYDPDQLAMMRYGDPYLGLLSPRFQSRTAALAMLAQEKPDTALALARTLGLAEVRARCVDQVARLAEIDAQGVAAKLVNSPGSSGRARFARRIRIPGTGGLFSSGEYVTVEGFVEVETW